MVNLVNLALRHKRLIAVILFLGILLAVFEISGLRNHFSLAFLKSSIQENRIIGLLTFILLFSLGNLIQIPGWLFLAAAVLTLGKVMGGVATFVAASISCVLTFLAIRYIGGDALRRMDNRIAARIFGRLDAWPVLTVFLLRTLFQTVPALNYTLALSGVRFRNYLAGTLLGLPLPILIYAMLFDYVAIPLGTH